MVTGVILRKVMLNIHMFLISRAIMANLRFKHILIKETGHSINGGTVGKGGKTSVHLQEGLEVRLLYLLGRRIGWIVL
ncbi:hypothetical protein HFA01_04530 [Halobacillus faecis]|uniref:Uncharacterized protein n=1 Tax=Halobacillus faecis TaxID=360184 RepID=A0A511WNX1_9BACI|nr:hypothetical protein HFA01_04530 [Halobacillus faecis]